MDPGPAVCPASAHSVVPGYDGALLSLDSAFSVGAGDIVAWDLYASAACLSFVTSERGGA